MIERPESGQDPNEESFTAKTPKAGHFLKAETTEDVDASGVEDESEGMTKPDFLGKSNLENRE